MTLESKLKIESKGLLAASVFFAVVGVVFLTLLLTSGFPPHIGVIGILSLITAYGLFRRRAWAFWLVAILFFAATTLSAFLIYSLWTKDYLIGVSMIAYLALTWAFTAYVVTKRKMLED